MLPRQPVLDPPEDKGGKKKGGGGAIGPIAGLIQLSGQDLDEQLINHVYNQSLTYVHNLVRLENHIKLFFQSILVCYIDYWRTQEPGWHHR